MGCLLLRGRKRTNTGLRLENPWIKNHQEEIQCWGKHQDLYHQANTLSCRKSSCPPPSYLPQVRSKIYFLKSKVRKLEQDFVW